MIYDGKELRGNAMIVPRLRCSNETKLDRWDQRAKFGEMRIIKDYFKKN